jgi:hypothetical protein
MATCQRKAAEAEPIKGYGDEPTSFQIKKKEGGKLVTTVSVKQNWAKIMLAGWLLRNQDHHLILGRNILLPVYAKVIKKARRPNQKLSLSFLFDRRRNSYGLPSVGRPLCTSKQGNQRALRGAWVHLFVSCCGPTFSVRSVEFVEIH